MLFDYYWSFTPDKVSSFEGWKVSFNYGLASKDHGQGSLLYVLAVRGGNNYPVNVFVDNGNGTITDKITGLMWQKEMAPGRFTWSQALEYTSNLILAGYSDWRLPNINELQTLIDYSTRGPAIYPIFKPHTENRNYYWSSTTYLRNYAFNIPDSWTVCFYDGRVGGGHKQLSIPSVRAVRTVQETVLTDLEKANIIFNWLESEFPEILSPVSQPTYESDGISFRYCPGTNVYIGTIHNDLYFYDHLSVLNNLGGVDIWLPYAKGVN